MNNITALATARPNKGGAMNAVIKLRDAVRSPAKWFRCRLCRVLCGDRFFNRDASLEIDRLIIENERLRERLSVVDNRHE